MDRCIAHTDRMLYFCTDCPKPDFRGAPQRHAVWNNLLQCGLYRDADCAGFIWGGGTIIICRVSHSAPCDHVVLGIVFFYASEETWGKILEEGAPTSLCDRCIPRNDCHDEKYTFVSFCGKEHCSPRIMQYRHVHVFNRNDLI